MHANGIAVRSARRTVFCLVAPLLFSVLLAGSAPAAVSQSGDNSSNPTSAGASPKFGITDIGRFTLSDGQSVSSNVVIIGDTLTGIGLVTITDFNTTSSSASTWTTNSLMVGNAGTARLDVLNGAVVSVDFAGNPGVGDFVVGNAVTAVGTVTVDGLGSMMRLGDDTVIGQLGTGTLRISNNGYVIGTNGAATDTDIFTIGVHGRLELATNGRLRTEIFANHGAIIGSGQLDSVNTIVNAIEWHIDVTTGDRLVVTAALTNNGAISLNGGEIEFYKAVTNSGAGSELTLRDKGIVRFDAAGFGYDVSTGVLATTAGTNDIYGTVRIQTAGSKISVSGGSTAVFHDPVTNTGGTIEVFPGSTIVYLQGLTTTGSGSALAVNLSDPDSAPGAGAIEVSSAASLAGDLKVSLAPGFKPSAGDVFPILTAAGGISGTLNLVSAPPLPGGMLWQLDVTASNVLLSVVATGDYNGNGVVDAADYVVWRASQSLQGPGLGADSNGDGLVNAADYNFWRSRLGNSVGTAQGIGGTVPEPGCAILLMAAGVFASFIRKRA